MVSYDTEYDPEEVSELEMTPTGEITGEWNRILTCADCGTELSSCNMEINESVAVPEDCKPGETHDWELDVTVTPTDRLEDKDRRGKPIKNTRYMKRYYGIQVEMKAKCVVCEAEVEETFTEESPASCFESMV